MSILVVGGGKMGLSHIAILNRLLAPGEVALCDPSRLVRFVFGKLRFQTFKTLEEALAQPKRWSGAVVASPTFSHYAIATELLERGIPCFIEKPLTLDPEKSQTLLDMQARQNTPVQMGLVLRFVQPFTRLRSITSSGALGAVLSYRARMLGNVVTKPDPGSWRTDFARGGGCLNEYGPHLLDLCRAIFGDVTSLRSASFGRIYSTRADDSVQISWLHSNGVPGELQLDWCDSTRRKSYTDFDVRFEKGSVHANNAELSVQPDDMATISPAVYAELFAPALPYPVNFYLRGEEYSLQLEVFLERVLGRKMLHAEIDSGTAADLGDGYVVDRLIKDIARLGGLA